MAKMRLDLLLVEKNMFPSREKARSAIMAGLVFVGGKKIDKAGTEVEETSPIEIHGRTLPYVSRGGLKLEKALKNFPLDVVGKVVLDIGASTGGFTDCALQNGAVKVYAVDVGYGQLDWKLRSDERVVVMEKTNVRYLKTEDLADVPEIATIDVSFISLEKVLAVVKDLIASEGQILALIKPQFEAGREQVGKKGVVRDSKVHEEVCQKILNLAQSLNLKVQAFDFSPITGPEGNIEYLILLAKNLKTTDIDNISEIVQQAHEELKTK